MKKIINYLFILLLLIFLIIILLFKFYNNWEVNLNNNWEVNLNNDKISFMKNNSTVNLSDFQGKSDVSLDLVYIKNWFSIPYNQLNNLVNYCLYREWKTEDYYENWEKIELKNIKEDIAYWLFEDYKWTDLEKSLQKKYFLELLDWNIIGSYEYFNDIKKISISDFNELSNFFLLFWNYMLSIKDDILFDEYSNIYLSELKNLDVSLKYSFVSPLLNAHLDYYWKCSDFFKENFINY